MDDVLVLAVAVRLDPVRELVAVRVVFRRPVAVREVPVLRVVGDSPFVFRVLDATRRTGLEAPLDAEVALLDARRLVVRVPVLLEVRAVERTVDRGVVLLPSLAEVLLLAFVVVRAVGFVEE